MLLLLGNLREYLRLSIFVLIWFSLLTFRLFRCLHRFMCVTISFEIEFVVWSLFFNIHLWVLRLLTIRFDQEFVLFSSLLRQKLLWGPIKVYRSEILIKRVSIHDLSDKHSIFIIQLAIEFELFLDLDPLDAMLLLWLCLALDTLLAQILRPFIALDWLHVVRLPFLIFKSL